MHGMDREMSFPKAEWECASPESEGVDPSLLAAAVTDLREHTPRDGVNELFVVRHGRVIWQGPNAGHTHGVWSVTKSFTSTALGLLIDDGKTTLDARVKDYLPEFEAAYPDVTLRHLTTMTSGYRAVGDEPRGSYVHGPSRTPFAVSPTPLFAPGSMFAYWDSAMNQLGHVLTRIAGEPLRELFQRRIGDRIGLAPERWNWPELDAPDGLKVCCGSGNHARVQICASDLARLGLLFLNGGLWDGARLLSAEWVGAATSAQAPASLPVYAPVSAINGMGVYGYNWWVNGCRANGLRKWPGAPAGAFAAHGAQNNAMFVIPEWDMVIVRLGLDEDGGKLNDLIYNAFLAKVGRAVGEE